MAERCPLCQGKLQNGECLSCGYRIPDEDEISALYNYDPSDYPQPEQEQEHIREIIPDVQMEEIYPNRPEPVNLKVRNSQGKTVRKNYGQTAQNDQPYYRQQNNQYPQTGQYGQNAGQLPPYYQQLNNPYSPYNNQGYYGNNRQNGNVNNLSDTVNEFFTKYWWLVLLCLFAPVFGIFAFVLLKNQGKADKKYNTIFTILMILSILRFFIF